MEIEGNKEKRNADGLEILLDDDQDIVRSRNPIASIDEEEEDDDIQVLDEWIEGNVKENGGGFIVNGSLVTVQNEDVVEISDDDDVKMGDQHSEIDLISVLPLSKSRLLSCEAPPAVYNYDVEAGYIKEFIDKDGLGIIFNTNIGVVLFHSSQFKGNNGLRTGQKVFFAVYFTTDKERYSNFSQEGILCQAIGIWSSEPSDGDVDAIKKKENEILLKAHADKFVEYFTRKPFIALSHVRVGGKIDRYLSQFVGVIKSDVDNLEILFHVNNVYLYRKKFQRDKRTRHIGNVLPTGLKVAFDARKLNVFIRQNFQYQAVVVLIGSWPPTPHPTLFPGGEGSVSCYDDTPNSTFYYLELDLNRKLEKNLNDIWNCEEYFNQSNQSIRNRRDYIRWQSCYMPRHLQNLQKNLRLRGEFRKRRDSKRENFHIFKNKNKKDEYKVEEMADIKPDISQLQSNGYQRPIKNET